MVQIQNLRQILDPVLVGLRYCSVLYEILFFGLQSLVPFLCERTQLRQADGRGLLVVLVSESLIGIPGFDERRRLPRARRLVL